MYLKFFKRPLDLLISVPALILVSPVLVAAALAVLIVMGRPILFRQQRAGRDGKVFWIPKFRTMREGVDAAGRPLPDHLRMTGLGRLLRKFSLDELPQLWSVILGHMSLIGPRPLLASYLPRYSAEQARRHEVRPGITGWAQINGRNAIDWETKFELDVWYVDHVTLALDLRIILGTMQKLWQTRDTQRSQNEAMPEFLGNINK